MTASGSVMFGLRRALSMAPLMRSASSSPDSPSPSAGTARYRADMAAGSIMTANRYRFFEVFLYTACLNSPRSVAFIFVPSPTR